MHYWWTQIESDVGVLIKVTIDLCTIIYPNPFVLVSHLVSLPCWSFNLIRWPDYIMMCARPPGVQDQMKCGLEIHTNLMAVRALIQNVRPSYWLTATLEGQSFHWCPLIMQWESSYHHRLLARYKITSRKMICWWM